MGRRQGDKANKREDILLAAMSCILEQGFDGTSVRAIMKRAGAEVGLFYYYFKNKDEAFDCVLDRFFEGYVADFEQILSRGRRNPCRVMEDSFSYIERETKAFRSRYAAKMHRTVRWAIREHTLTLIEPFIRQVVDIQSSYYGVPPAIAPEVAALYLTHGVGSAILHEDNEKFFAVRKELKRGVSLLMGMPMQEQSLRIPLPAQAGDAPAIIALLEQTGFSPPIDETLVKARIASDGAWMLCDEKNVAAVLMYEKERGEIDCVVVAPAYRKRGLATKLLETAAAQLPVGASLSMTLTRQEMEGARAFLEAMGFAPNKGEGGWHYGITVPDAPLGMRQNNKGEGE